MRLPLLVLHIFAGTLGLLAGSVALAFRKGSRGHRVSGSVFVISMLIMATAAFFLAIMKSQLTNVLGAILTFYMISTAWATVRHQDGRMGAFDFGALMIGLTLGATEVTLGVEAARSPIGLQYGYPATLYFIFGAVPLLAVAGDVRMLLRGGIFGVHRIARHLWRMCFGLFIATGSFFLGQQQVFPAFLRKSNALFIPALLPIGLMIFWLIRVRLRSNISPSGDSKRASAGGHYGLGPVL